MFDRLSILVNGVTGVPQTLQSVSILEENYAKTIRSHSTAAPLSAKDGRIHIGASKPETLQPKILFIRPLL
jgi:hypothetical protein